MIIGIAGTVCAGKGTIASILVNKYGFEKLVFSGWLRNELKRRGIEITRKNLQDVADELRKNFGENALAIKLKETLIPGKNYVIDGFRNPGEVIEFRKFADFILVGIDAPVEIRMKRMLKRGRADDAKNVEEFKILENRDRGIGQEKFGQQSIECYKMANRYILNSGSFESLMEEIDKMMGELKCL